MILHGIAVSAIPDEKNHQKIHVTCTPVAVSSDNPNSIKVLNALAFKTHYSTPAEMERCFIDLVNTLEEVMKLQKTAHAELQKLTGRKKPPLRPVQLYIGEALHRGMDLNGLYHNLFRETMRGVVSTVKPIKRWKDTPSSAAFGEACEKLARLLPDCTMKEGQFHEVAGENSGRKMRDTNVHQWVRNLRKDLKKPDKAAKAHELLKQIAYCEGQDMGEEASVDSYIFSTGLPKDYMASRLKQAQFPLYSFYTWDPDYKEAFHKGHDDNYFGVLSRRHKLGIESHSEHFVDPLVDEIRAQIQIAEGRRLPEYIDDIPKRRLEIAKSALRAVEYVKEVAEEKLADRLHKREPELQTRRIKMRELVDGERDISVRGRR